MRNDPIGCRGRGALDFLSPASALRRSGKRDGLSYTEHMGRSPVEERQEGGAVVLTLAAANRDRVAFEQPKARAVEKLADQAEGRLQHFEQRERLEARRGSGAQLRGHGVPLPRCRALLLRQRGAKGSGDCEARECSRASQPPSSRPTRPARTTVETPAKFRSLRSPLFPSPGVGLGRARGSGVGPRDNSRTPTESCARPQRVPRGEVVGTPRALEADERGYLELKQLSVGDHGQERVVLGGGRGVATDGEVFEKGDHLGAELARQVDGRCFGQGRATLAAESVLRGFDDGHGTAPPGDAERKSLRLAERTQARGGTGGGTRRACEGGVRGLGRGGDVRGLSRGGGVRVLGRGLLTRARGAYDSHSSPTEMLGGRPPVNRHPRDPHGGIGRDRPSSATVGEPGRALPPRASIAWALVTSPALETEKPQGRKGRKGESTAKIVQVRRRAIRSSFVPLRPLRPCGFSDPRAGLVTMAAEWIRRLPTNRTTWTADREPRRSGDGLRAWGFATNRGREGLTDRRGNCGRGALTGDGPTGTRGEPMTDATRLDSSPPEGLPGALPLVATLVWPNKPVLPTAPSVVDETAVQPLRRQTGQSLGGQDNCKPRRLADGTDSLPEV